MAFGITIEGDAITGYQLNITDADTQGDLIRITRQDQSGHYDDAVVRGIDQIETITGVDILFDYEAPLNTELKYIYEIYDVADLDTPVVDGTIDTVETIVPLGFVVVTQIADSALRVSGAVLELSQWSTPGRIRGTHYVLGQRNPVVITDVQGGRTGTIVMSNLNIHEVDFDGSGPYDTYTTNYGYWGSIFRAGETLLFRNDWTASGFDDLYFQTTGVEHTRLSRVLGTEDIPIFQYSIEYIEVDRPRTDLLSLISGQSQWQQVLSSNADWQEVLDDHDTWLDVFSEPGA